MAETKKKNIELWLIELSKKKQIDLNDVDDFALFFFTSIEKAKSLHKSAKETEDLSIQASLNILALEEIAKPIILSENIPIPNKKWSVDLKSIKNIAKNLTHHPLKQLVTSKYGTHTGRLGFVKFLDIKEVKILEQIKQSGFYSNVDLSVGKSEDISNYLTKDLSNKLNSFVEERLKSLDMYNDLKKAKVFVRTLTLRKLFEFQSYFDEFIENLDVDKSMTYEHIINLASNFKPSKEIIPVVSLTNSENTPEKIAKKIIGVIQSAVLNDFKIINQKGISETFLIKYKILEKNIRDSVS